MVVEKKIENQFENHKNEILCSLATDQKIEDMFEKLLGRQRWGCEDGELIE